MNSTLLERLDALLNGVTMYRATLYALIAVWLCALAAATAGLLPFGPVEMIAAAAFILATCVVTNVVFARAFRVPANTESVYITAVILALIVSPPDALNYAAFLPLGVWASVLAMASKFVLAIRRKHLFNPAAVAVLLTALALDETASWWVGTAWLAAPTLLAGLFVARKLRRFDSVLVFLGVTTVLSLVFGFAEGRSILTALDNTWLNSPAMFVAFFMLTEPLTAPPGRVGRIAFAALAGTLITPAVHIAGLYFTPELALVIANAFAYLVSPKDRLLLTLRERVQLAADTFEYVFAPNRGLRFAAGQYLEWTLGHAKPDSRGIRRYFTLASAPADPLLRLGVKLPAAQSSTFKTALNAMRPGDTILASQLAGDFVLPADRDAKLCFIAGGIGITPFISMLQELLRRGERRSIVVLYGNNAPDEIAYDDVLTEAEGALGITVVRTVLRINGEAWDGAVGRIDSAFLQRHVPDAADRLFFVSGPQAMVSATARTLRALGVPARNIRKDFFPGLA